MTMVRRQFTLNPPKFRAEVHYRMTGKAVGFSANIVVRNGLVAEVDTPELVRFVGRGSQLIHLHAAQEDWRTELIGGNPSGVIPKRTPRARAIPR